MVSENGGVKRLVGCPVARRNQGTCSLIGSRIYNATIKKRESYCNKSIWRCYGRCDWLGRKKSWFLVVSSPIGGVDVGRQKKSLRQHETSKEYQTLHT